MNKILILACMMAISYAIQPSCGFAQVGTIAAAPLDAKTQKKVDKSKEDLAKYQKQLTKDVAAYEKDSAKFEKQNAAGKLSPRDVEKMKKSLKKSSEDIGKLKKKIGDLETYLMKFK